MCSVHGVFRIHHALALYCKLDRNETGASDPCGGCARDFVNFRKKFHASRALGAVARVRQFTHPGVDVAVSLARRYHRKSKFGLRRGINYLYA